MSNEHTKRLPEEFVTFLAGRMQASKWTPERKICLKIALDRIIAHSLDWRKGLAVKKKLGPRLRQAEADPALYPELVADVLHWLFETTAEYRMKPAEARLVKAQQTEIMNLRDNLQRSTRADWFPVEGMPHAQQLLAMLQTHTTPKAFAVPLAEFAYVAITGRQQDVRKNRRPTTKQADEIGQYVAILGMDVLWAAGFNQQQKREGGLNRATAAEFLAGFARQHWGEELKPDVIEAWYSGRSMADAPKRTT